MTHFRITSWNQAGILAAVDIGQDAMADELNKQLQLAITSEIWTWPRSPSPRDIVDTGALKKSQQMRKNGRRGVLYSWSVGYAQFVHDGVVLRNGTVLPARPWTKVALEKADLPRVFNIAFRSAMA